MFYFGKKGDETKGEGKKKEGSPYSSYQNYCLLGKVIVIDGVKGRAVTVPSDRSSWDLELDMRKSHFWAGATECLKSEGDILHLMRRSNVYEMILHGPETAKQRVDVSHR